MSTSSSPVPTVATNAFDSIAKGTRNTGQLGKSEFLKLLVTQMKYQNPMSPMSNENFIAQLAQFSSLESMQNIQQGFDGLQTYNLIGKTVIKIDPQTLEQTQGVVSGVKQVSGKYTLILPKSSTDRAPAKADVQQAFGTTQLDYNRYKDLLFTPESLQTNQLKWNPQIDSIEKFTNVLGYTSSGAMP
ncbi:MAG: flagellar hook capping FlgD N-terminal domain-containing protein, partial [Candidatus Margulisiibacteriota bacterium]